MAVAKKVIVRGDGKMWIWTYHEGARAIATSVDSFDRKGNAVNAGQKVADAFGAKLYTLELDKGTETPAEGTKRAKYGSKTKAAPTKTKATRTEKPTPKRAAKRPTKSAAAKKVKKVA